MDAYAKVQCRCQDAGIEGDYSCYSFRATGITSYLENGGDLEKAQYIAGHADSLTTKLYNQRARKPHWKTSSGSAISLPAACYR